VTALVLLLVSVEFGAATALSAWKLNALAVGGAALPAAWLILGGALRVRARPEESAARRPAQFLQADTDKDGMTRVRSLLTSSRSGAKRCR
jgi:hypothetical protein